MNQKRAFAATTERSETGRYLGEEGTIVFTKEHRVCVVLFAGSVQACCIDVCRLLCWRSIIFLGFMQLFEILMFGFYGYYNAADLS